MLNSSDIHECLLEIINRKIIVGLIVASSIEQFFSYINYDEDFTAYITN